MTRQEFKCQSCFSPSPGPLYERMLRRLFAWPALRSSPCVPVGNNSVFPGAEPSPLFQTAFAMLPRLRVENETGCYNTVTLTRNVLVENDWDLTKMKTQCRCKLSCDSTTFSLVEVSRKVPSWFCAERDSRSATSISLSLHPAKLVVAHHTIIVKNIENKIRLYCTS